MKFLFEATRSESENRILKLWNEGHWLVDDIFPEGEVSAFSSESERLKWAPVLASLAFGEGTAFHGFGSRIADSEDISAKTWLTMHLVDEGRHTEGFSRMLTYLYPSYQGAMESLLKSRDVFVFYGHTHKSADMTEWLLCTQIAEVFGRQCYRELFSRLASDPKVREFLGQILKDEQRHIGYISMLIEKQRERESVAQWKARAPFIETMTAYARNMFEGRKRGANYKSFQDMGIDVSAFCDRAQQEILSRFVSWQPEVQPAAL